MCSTSILGAVPPTFAGYDLRFPSRRRSLVVGRSWSTRTLPDAGCLQRCGGHVSEDRQSATPGLGVSIVEALAGQLHPRVQAADASVERRSHSFTLDWRWEHCGSRANRPRRLMVQKIGRTRLLRMSPIPAQSLLPCLLCGQRQLRRSTLDRSSFRVTGADVLRH